MNTNTFPRMHVSLFVKNIQETVAFYDKFFGQAASKVQPRYAKYELAEPSLIISFVEDENMVKPLFGHLGFQVASLEKLAELQKTATANNLKTLEEKGVACCYAEQDKFWVADPDGYRWEIYYFHKDVAFNDPAYELGASSKEKSVVGMEALPIAKAKSSCCAPSSCN